MNKRFVLVILFLIPIVGFSSSLLFSQETIKYQFELISLKPIHKEYFADKNRPDKIFQCICKFSGFPEDVHQDSNAYPKVFPKGSWGTELAPIIQQQLSNSLFSEFSFHHGHSPLKSFYYIKDASWASICLTSNPDPSVSLFENRRFI